MRAAHTRARDQKQRLRWTGWTAASYALDTLFLGLFWTAGHDPGGSVPLAYGLAGAAICGAVVRRDRHRPQPAAARSEHGPCRRSALAVLLQLAVVGMAPQLAFPFLANLFTVFAFGMTWTPVRQAVAGLDLRRCWRSACCSTRWASGSRCRCRRAAERVLVWSYFSLILGRCLLLSVQANELRRRLQEGRRKLADSLEQVQQLASHDELTRTLNRRSLMARARAGAQPRRARRRRRSASRCSTWIISSR